jgi:hypothetical protein
MDLRYADWTEVSARVVFGESEGIRPHHRVNIQCPLTPKENHTMKRPIHTTSAAFVAFLSIVCLTALQAAEKQRIVEPFNGKDLTGWKLVRPEGSYWVVGAAQMDSANPGRLAVSEAQAGKGELINREAHGVDIFSEQEFGDCTVCLEVMVPKGSNSGIYLMGNYEVQILDSFGKTTVGPGDIGGLYGAAAPRLNAAKAPGEWQQFVIEFQAPRFQDGKKVANAVFKKVTLNGQVIHENAEMKGVTGGNLGRGEQPTGPLMFQGNHGPVVYRNIKITVSE